MSGADYRAAHAEAERFRYPDSEVLINRAGLTDQAQPDAFERARVARKLRTLKPLDPTNYTAFNAAHLHLFGDIFDWAGQERTYTTGRGAASFARAEFITGEMERRFAAIIRQPGLQDAQAQHPGPAVNCGGIRGQCGGAEAGQWRCWGHGLQKAGACAHLGGHLKPPP